ncbi:izumo sperm-egg fusion protein 4 [Alligator sinensis]|uniref:Izumo sperm-egg fusion protein 4 n=1 Tax=Alligator sinensis TaxID=38654 RepID=A0A1U7S9H5_ALLSI|nr:izumo sperm-egg fusion protein 4 [Alligator sinensis]
MGTARWLLGLWVAAALALGVTRGCLQCDPGFTTHFTTYKPRFSLWPWGLGGRSAVTKLLQAWPGDTLQELELRIPAEIPMNCLHHIAVRVYERLDKLLQNKRHSKAVLLKDLRSIFREQVQMLRKAIIESRMKCERHCGIAQYDTVSCTTCDFSSTPCFGYNCESSEEWEEALKGLFAYIKNIPTKSEDWAVTLRRIPGFHNCSSTSPAMLNFERINATMSETWHTMLENSTEGQQMDRSLPERKIDC